MIGEPTIGLAILAGFVSFISPCVLPLVPAYVGYMGGHATASATDSRRNRFSTFINGIFFVLGFTAFFVGFGLLTNAFSSVLASIGVDIPTILTRLGGVAVIFFGLYIMKALDPVFRRGLKMAEYMKKDRLFGMLFTVVFAVVLGAYLLWAFEASPDNPVAIGLAAGLFLLIAYLFRNEINGAQSLGDFWSKAIIKLQTALISDTRNLNMKKREGYLGSFGMGTVFAAGWTPCIGPIYASILTLTAEASADGASLLSAAGLLFAYSMGLGIPFLITALALNQMSGLMRGLKRNMRRIEFASGFLLILIGTLILSGNMEEFTRVGADGELGEFSVRLEACTIGAAEGHIHLSTWTSCVSDGTDKLTNVSSPLSARFEVRAEPLFRADPAFNYDDTPVGLAVGEVAPDFSTVDPAGNPVNLSDYRGDQLLILNFWATWCGPCRVEMPEFQTAFEEYGKQGLRVLAVDFLEEADAVQAFVDEMELTFDIGMDVSGEINDSFAVRSYPSTYIIDGNGVIRAKHAGPLTGEQLLEIIKEIEGDDA